MRQCIIHITLMILASWPLVANAYHTTANQDTIPPVFTTPPANISFDCDATNLSTLFANWFQGQAGAIADDGEATVLPTTPLNVALDSLDQLSNNLCVNGDALEIDFFAIDSCGNRSIETLTASFILTDSEKPQFAQPATDKDIYCTLGILDSLQLWLDSGAGSEIIDNCSGGSFSNYIWNDDQGNSGFSEFGDSTNISIQRTTCNWQVTVSFFAEDNCGNDNVTTANFRIIGDTIAPTVINSLSDTFLLCEQAIPDDIPEIQDLCDGLLTTVAIDSSTQISSVDSCGHYRYKLIRQWVGEDACGNIAETSRTYTIDDTLAPIINLSPTVALNCDEDLSDLTRLISVTDACATPKISFRDSVLFNSACQNQFIRIWKAEDPCGNIDSIEQTIQVQDFSGPQFNTLPADLNVNCSNTQLNQIFDQWVIDNTVDITDGCNGVTLKVLPPGDYSDTTIIINTPAITFQNAVCAREDTIGITNNIDAYYIAYDGCGNITEEIATFSISDEVAPSLTNCPSDFNLQVNEDQCSVDYRLILPAFTDNCLLSEDAEWIVNIDGMDTSVDNQQVTTLSLDLGPHILTYTLIDCGQNSASCTQNINVADNTSPNITCPDSIQIYVGIDDCSVGFNAPSLVSYQDNCFGTEDFVQTQPDQDGFIVFSFNSIENVYQPSDYIIPFTDVSFNGLTVSPHLLIEYKLSLTDNSEIAIVSELGELITRISNASCTETSRIVELNPDDLRLWAEDGTVRFPILNQSNGGQGTTPCSPGNITGSQGIDNDTYLRITLIYTDLQPDVTITNNQSGTTSQITDPLDLSPNNYTLTYTAADAVGNSSSCTTEITVSDTIAPEITCLEMEYILDPMLNGFYPIIESDLMFNAQDNCDFAIIDFEPRQVFCTDLSTSYSITGTDPSGNLSSCSSTISILKPELNPSFVSGLCLADTIKFQANLPEFSNFTFEWTGPDNFSSTQANPILTGIDENSSGEYNLIATSNGCSFEGSLQIDVELFDSPEIFSNLTTICNGEELLINTNSFTEIVEYFWFEGISPNGTLISRTDGPSLILNPTEGTHLYYVEVRGDNCNSNPSNTLEILVTTPPAAEISDPFITTCVGEDIVLMTDVFNPNLEYEWSGPNNYMSSGQFPDVIENITESNQGTYTLITKEGECISDTATAQVIVFPQPTLPIITGESIYCEGQSAVLTVPNVANGTNYQWFNEGIFYSAGSSNSLLIPSISQSESGEWTVIAEVGICNSDTSETFFVNIESTLSIGATNNGPVCEGDSITLTTSFIPNAIYRWTDPNGTVVEGRIVTVLAESGVYTVEVTTDSNCSASTTTVVEVGLRPTITAVSNTSLPCMSGNSPVAFVSTVFPPGNYQYNWSGPNGFSSSQEEPIIQNFSTQNNGTYTLTVINADCESTPSFNDINITLIPDTPEIVSSTTPCLGDDVILTVTNPTIGNNVSWVWTTPSGQQTTVTPELTIQDFNNTNSGNYSAIQINEGCRSEASIGFDLQLQSAPLTPIVSGVENACAGDDIILSVDIDNADSYLWFTPQGTTSRNTNELELLNVQEGNTGGYSVFISSGNCTSDTSIVFNLQVNPIPAAPSFVDEVIDLCTTDLDNIEICLTNLIEPIDEVRLIDVSTQTTLQTGDSECLDLSFLINSPGNFELAAVSILNECSSPIGDILNLNLATHPSIGAEVNDTLILCGRDFTNISTISTPDNTEVFWFSDDPEINLIDQNSNTVSVSNLRPGNNNIFINSSSGQCLDYFTDTIVVTAVTTPIANDDILDLPFGQEITIQPLLNDVINRESNITINAEPNRGTAIISESTILYSPDSGLVGDDEILYEVCLQDCPDECDQASIFLTIGVEVDCFVGNLVTPNGDGYNDALRVPCLETGEYESNSILIFNEWGDEVYNSAPYNNDWQGMFNGKLLPVGTYYYILDLGDGSRPLSGFIILEL